MSKNLLEITFKIDSLVKKNEELTSQLTVAQNTSKVFQEAFNTTSSKLLELERQHHIVELYLRRECLDLSGIPSSVSPKDLENFVLRLSQEIGVDLDNSQVVACHRLGKTDRTIFKFLNRKVAENVFSNKRKLNDVDIFCLLSDGIQNTSDMTPGDQNDWREGGMYRKGKCFISQNLCQYYRYLYNLVKEKMAEGLIFYFWVFNGTIRMRELQDSRVINITHESDI